MGISYLSDGQSQSFLEESGKEGGHETESEVECNLERKVLTMFIEGNIAQYCVYFQQTQNQIHGWARGRISDLTPDFDLLL